MPRAKRPAAERSEMSAEELRWAIYPRHEKDFTTIVMRDAEARGLLAYHTHDSRRSPAGFPDLVIVDPGQRPGVVYAELKMAGNYPDAKQREWLTSLVDAGQHVYLFYPKDYETIISVLNGARPPGYELIVRKRRARDAAATKVVESSHWYPNGY